MTHRGLKLETTDSGAEPKRKWASDASAETFRGDTGGNSAILGSQPGLDMAQPEYSGVEPGESLLGRFHDAIEVGRACEFLEAEEVKFRLDDVAKPRSGFRGYDSPPVELNLIVGKADRERAMKVLREKMGLFPLQEVDAADEAVDDGTLSALGQFGRREDAEEVVNALDDARIWHRIVANPEGNATDENAWTLEVREVDLMVAGEVVEKAMNLPE
jgi:hypothetical protein